jgi:hypothetical protein
MSAIGSTRVLASGPPLVESSGWIRTRRGNLPAVILVACGSATGKDGAMARALGPVAIEAGSTLGLISPSAKAYKAAMNWVGGIFGLALVAVVVAVGTDVYMTKCQPGSFYAAIGLCSPSGVGEKPEPWRPTPVDR